MSVRSALNIESLFQASDETWPEWTRPEGVLAHFTCAQDVASWRATVPWQEDREVFLALGRLMLEPESRAQATAALVFLVLPACESVVSARSTRTRDFRHVEQVAAGYVWSEVVQYPWDAPLRGWIPQGVARRVGRALDREFGWGRASERVWRERAVVAPDVLDFVVDRHAGQVPLQSSQLYWWALTEARLPREDLDLLVALAVTAAEHGITARSSAGITARSACLQLARPGESADVVQSRAIRALKQLRQAARPAA
ncbi:hypothetical protein [Tessaracoccus sp. MC1756]|uniref:hypothetical protein n=1 Tax=Tessaracoccus sp. MC1756 TaxID=2760311 RepID=UPI00160466B4|nr:hypothetical protein [Tessaracoccus sp. MC1756]MBB1510650.1 hypothetical protein [Tessaracoccus sp. MC1756]